MEDAMRLTPSDAEPGLWVNPDWQEGSPGMFAVVIGVSRYLHLAEGESPAPETFGLGQLRVSALTAFEVFRWLAEGYRVEGCPLAKCWLLLSPAEEEKEHAPGIAEHLPPATFDNCEQAIGFWWSHMQQLPRSVAEHSRALFFFSGHGLETHQDQQILLLSDYLKPPQCNCNKALSTESLKKGLASLAVPHQLFLLDACRNDHYVLRAKKITGAPVLTEDEAALVNPALVAPLLFATAPGQQALQHMHPDRGLSLFGRALLDGLLGKPTIHLDCQGHVCSVNLYPLQGYMKQRVVELLTEVGAQVIQPVKLGGSSIDNVPITYLEHAAVLTARPELALPPTRGPGGELMGTGVPTPGERAARIEKTLRDLFTVEREVAPETRRSIWAQKFAIGHDLFGSEAVTAIWSEQVRLYALDKRSWIDNPDTLVLHKIERDDAARSYRAEISVAEKDQVGHWLELVDGAGTAHGCFLPADRYKHYHYKYHRYKRPRYVLEFDVTFDEGSGCQISRLEASLSMKNSGLLGAAAELWQRYRMADVGEAVNAFEISVLERMVCERLDSSPLAATVAALILLRANRLDLLHNWLHNLANWFDEQSDGPALWAEQVLQQQPRGIDAAIAEAAEYLGLLIERGLPHTGEALSYAAGLSDRLARLIDRVPQGSRPKLERLHEQIGNALVFFRPGGLFTSYAGFTPGTDPWFQLA
jgi:hypothetical protein